MGFFENTLIAVRIRLLTIAVMLGFTATTLILLADMVVEDFASDRKEQALVLSSEVSNLHRLAFESQKSGTTFLAVHRPEYIEEFRRSLSDLRQSLRAFAIHPLVVADEQLMAQQETTISQLSDYNGHMERLFAQWLVLGLNENDGLHGALRTEAHAIEDVFHEIEGQQSLTDRGEVLLLTLRRHEKDFIQRLEQKYIDRFTSTQGEFQAWVEGTLSGNSKEIVSTHALQYQQAFLDYSNLHLTILADEQGLRDEASQFVETVNTLHRAVLAQMKVVEAEASLMAKWFFWGALAVVILTAVSVILLARRVSVSITEPLQDLVGAMKSYLSHNYDTPVPDLPAGTEFGTVAAIMRQLQGQARAKEEAEEKLQQAHASLEVRVKARTRELEQANEELSQFAYVVSHDIKAPLRAIHSYSDFLAEDLEGKLEEEQEGYLRAMSRAVAEGEQLIEDVLSLSRVGRRDTEKYAVDLSKVFADVEKATVSGPECELNYSDTWPPVLGNPVLLKQIFSNLVSNGFKFNDAETKRVDIIGGLTPDDMVEVRVSDNGIGLDSKYHEKIFKIFQRLHTKGEYEGTGVGLAIVKKAVAELNGNITIENSDDGGACFVVRLPVGREKDDDR